MGISPLLSLELFLDMVKQFVLDFMHFGCLDIPKKNVSRFLVERKFNNKIGSK